jgi:DNA-binding transcriptional LysR family regulator
MAIELRWLRSFLAVANEMHFSRAARKLNLAQSALTTQIQQLESTLGVQLFDRANRLIGLTRAGLALVPEAQAVVERAAALQSVVARAASGETGRLRLGVIPPAATSIVAQCIRRFTEQSPAIELTVQQGSQERLVEQLVHGELDLIIGRPVSAGRNLASLSQEKVLVEEQGIVIAEDDDVAVYPKVRIRKLMGRRLLLLRGNPHFGQLLLAHAAKAGVRLMPIHMAEDFPSLHWMVRAGLGIAPCSLLLADGLPRGLTAKPLMPRPPLLQIVATWRTTEPPMEVQRLLRLFPRTADVGK